MSWNNPGPAFTKTSGFGPSNTPTQPSSPAKPITSSGTPAATVKQNVDASPFGYPVPGKKPEWLFDLHVNGKTGYFPIGMSNFWHGGIHLEVESAIVAIADGRVCAYRFPNQTEAVTYGSKTFKYSTGFVLVRHSWLSPKGTKFDFWALYMHTLPFGIYSAEQKKKMPLFAKKKLFRISAEVLNVRSSMDKTGSGNILKKQLKKGELADISIINAEWARLGSGEEYIYYKGNVHDEYKEGEPELDKLVLCNMPVKKGDTLGYTGPCGNDFISDSKRMVHFEIFGGEDFAAFISNPRNEGERAVLRVAMNNKLKTVENLYASPDKAEKSDSILPKNTPVKIFKTRGIGSDYSLVAPKFITGVIEAAWIHKGDHTGPHCAILPDKFADVKKALYGYPISAKQNLLYLGHCDAQGNKLADNAKTPYRLVRLSLTPDLPHRFWVKKSLLGKQPADEFTLDREITELFIKQPDGVKFEKNSDDPIAEEAFIPLETCEKKDDFEGRLFYKVKVPSRKHIWHFLIEEFGIPTDYPMTEGWIATDHPNGIYKAQPLSWMDWPGFSLEREVGANQADGFADIENLSVNLHSALRKIDASEDGTISRDELRDALKDKKISSRLSRLICRFPTEWQYSDAKYTGLNKHLSSPAQVEAVKGQLKKLAWWDDVAGKTEGFPKDPNVWHAHPLAFIAQMKKIAAAASKELIITFDELKKIAKYGKEKDLSKHLPGINLAFKNFAIDTPLKRAHFLAQVINESGYFSCTKEQGVKDTDYGGFPGRGLIQLTYKSNYEAYGEFVNEDFTSSEDKKRKLEEDPHAANSAGWYWSKFAKLNDAAQKNDFIFIVRIVNGGFIGYNNRLAILKNALTVLDPEKTISTEYSFSSSKVYNEMLACFGWGIWHDPETDKEGCTKDNEKAKEGYNRFIELHDQRGKPKLRGDWYYYDPEEIRPFVEERLESL
jgi:predicted chitinase